MNTPNPNPITREKRAFINASTTDLASILSTDAYQLSRDEVGCRTLTDDRHFVDGTHVVRLSPASKSPLKDFKSAQADHYAAVLAIDV